MENILLLPLEGARWSLVSQKAGEQRFPVQEFRTRLSEISIDSSSQKNGFLHSGPEVLTDESGGIH